MTSEKISGNALATISEIQWCIAHQPDRFDACPDFEASWCSQSSFCLLTLLKNRNKQGQTRLSSYYEWVPMAERTALESEIIRKCLSRSELQCSFLEYRGYKVIYRRYASLFFIVGTKPSPDETDNPENELGLLEFIHTLVETMDKWAGSICELDIMYQLEQVHCT